MKSHVSSALLSGRAGCRGRARAAPRARPLAKKTHRSLTFFEKNGVFFPGENAICSCHGAPSPPWKSAHFRRIFSAFPANALESAPSSYRKLVPLPGSAGSLPPAGQAVGGDASLVAWSERGTSARAEDTLPPALPSGASPPTSPPGGPPPPRSGLSSRAIK